MAKFGRKLELSVIWPANMKSSLREERRKKTQRHSQTGRLEKSSIDLVRKYIGPRK